MLFRILLIFTTSLILFCDSAKSTANEPVFELKKFSPPLNDSISTIQAKVWNICNPALDSLSKMYIDSFTTEDPQLRLKYQTDFKNRQDTICVINGLKGGYKEYMWVLENSGKPENKHLF